MPVIGCRLPILVWRRVKWRHSALAVRSRTTLYGLPAVILRRWLAGSVAGAFDPIKLDAREYVIGLFPKQADPETVLAPSVRQIL